MICENCSNKHQGKYGSGRFCSVNCARGFSTKSKRQEINKKISKRLKKSVQKVCYSCNKPICRQNRSGLCRSCVKSNKKHIHDPKNRNENLWNIIKIISKGDYNYALVPGHPNATKYGYVLEHRIIMENYLNRILDNEEIVHHCDEIKKNNDIDNLELMLISEHGKYHSTKQGRKMVKLICPCCKDIFHRRFGQTFLSKKGIYTCCSRSCSGKFSKYIQINGMNDFVKEAMSLNVVSIFRKDR